VIAFEPKPNQNVRSREERFFSLLGGKLWIGQSDFIILKMDVALQSPCHLFWLLAQVTTFQFTYILEPTRGPRLFRLSKATAKTVVSFPFFAVRQKHWLTIDKYERRNARGTAPKNPRLRKKEWGNSRENERGNDHNPCTTLAVCAGQVCESGPAYVGERRVKVGNGATVNADMAAWGETPGTVAMAKAGFMPDNTSITAKKVRLARGVSVFDVFANTIISKPGSIRGATGPWPGTPGALCPIPVLSCGGPDVVLAPLEERTISPGTYGDVELVDGAVLRLEPGVYNVCSVRAGRSTHMRFLAGGPSELNVTGKLKISNGSFFGGENDGAPWPLVRVGGTRAIFGRDGETFAHIVSPGGKIRIGVGGVYNGTMCGRDLKGASRVEWSCTDPDS